MSPSDFLRGLARSWGPDLLGGPVDLAEQVINLGLAGGGYLGHKAGLLRTDQLPEPLSGSPGTSEWWARGTPLSDPGTGAYVAGRTAGAVAPALPALLKGLAGAVDAHTSLPRTSRQRGGVVFDFPDRPKKLREPGKEAVLPEKPASNRADFSRTTYSTLDEALADTSAAAQRLEQSGVQPGDRFLDNWGGRNWIYDVVEDSREGLLKGLAREQTSEGWKQGKFALPPERLAGMQKHPLQPGEVSPVVAQRYYGGRQDLLPGDVLFQFLKGFAEPPKKR